MWKPGFFKAGTYRVTPGTRKKARRRFTLNW
jgi:hypothetical protein